MIEEGNQPEINQAQRALGILAQGIALGLLRKFQNPFQCTSIVSKRIQPAAKTPTAFHTKAQGRGAHPGYAMCSRILPQRGCTMGWMDFVEHLWCTTFPLKEPRVRIATLGFVVEPRCGSFFKSLPRATPWVWTGNNMAG